MAWVSWDKLTLPKSSGGLGFREIGALNDALLAKIGWRLIEDPNSLLAQVLLGKYCHSTYFMECKAPSSASHGWRGILAGREILKKGLGWSIGNGNSVKVWQDPWLSLDQPQAPIGPPSLSTEGLMVSDLLCPVSKDWNPQAIRQHLPQYEDQIRKFITSSSPLEDALVWLPNKSGKYSTKSGYAVAKVFINQALNAGFNWNRLLWRVKTSPKLKTFMWKVVSKALPVGEQLATRGLNTSASCPFCGEKEDEIHLFWQCHFAARVRNFSPLLHNPQIPADCSIHHLLQMLPASTNLLPSGLATTPLYPWILWHLWTARNKAIFENLFPSAEDLVTKAIRDAGEWSKAQISPQSSKPAQVAPSTAPIQPAVPSCFVDAAWNAVSGVCGLGWTLQAPGSDIITQHSASRPFVGSALVAEALALRCALDSASSPGITSLAVFSDSKSLISLIISKDSVIELRGILHDILVISSSFDSISFAFVSCLNNVLADGLAKSALFSVTVSSSNGV